MTEINTRMMAIGVAANHPDVVDLIERARAVEMYLDYRDLKIPTPAASPELVPLSGTGGGTTTYTAVPASELSPTAEIVSVVDKPARKPRGPNKAKALKTAKGKPGRKKKVAEAATVSSLEKDRPIGNGAGEHLEQPVAEPQQPMAA